MKRLEKKLNVNDFDPENILSSKEMRGIVGGWVRVLTSLPHLCQTACIGTQGKIRECKEGVCYDEGPYASCRAADGAVIFRISC